MLRVKKIVGSTLSSNMYILFEENTSDCWIVDIGDYNSLKKNLPHDVRVKGLFITHGHFDHIADINIFHKTFSDCVIYTSKYGKEQLYSAKKNFSFYHEKSTIYIGNVESLQILQNGDTIKLFDEVHISVLETPGHCPSCLTYYSDNYIFTGDSYIPGVDVVTKLPKGDKNLSSLSLNSIMTLCSERIVCPGHDKENWRSLF